MDAVTEWQPRNDAVIGEAPGGYPQQSNFDADCIRDFPHPSWEVDECRLFESVDAVVTGKIVDVEPVHDPRSPAPSQPEDACESWDASIKLTLEVAASTVRELEGATIDVWVGREAIATMGCSSRSQLGAERDFTFVCGTEVPIFVDSQPVIGISRGDVEHPWFMDGGTGLIYAQGAGQPLTAAPDSCITLPDDIVDWASLLRAREACPEMPGFRDEALRLRMAMVDQGLMFGPYCTGSLGRSLTECVGHRDCPSDQRCHRSGFCGSAEAARTSCIDDVSCPAGQRCVEFTAICEEELPGDR
jgi:hypothetical protein